MAILELHASVWNSPRKVNSESVSKIGKMANSLLRIQVEFNAISYPSLLADPKEKSCSASIFCLERTPSRRHSRFVTGWLEGCVDVANVSFCRDKPACLSSATVSRTMVSIILGDFFANVLISGRNPIKIFVPQLDHFCARIFRWQVSETLFGDIW
jgi:hypothetical protein